MARRRTTKAKATEAPSDFITELVDELVKEGGPGTAQILGGDGLKIAVRGLISTRIVSLDRAIGRAGIPLGRLTIIHGPESSGKTTLALMLVAECQAMGGVVVYIDVEYKLDPEYAATLGVDLDRLVISQPPYLERVFAIIEKATLRARALRSKTGKRVPILIVLDSMNAAISKVQFEGDWDDADSYAPQARVYSQKLPKIIPIISKEDVAVLFISQIREKIGITFGNKDKVAGGKAPKFYASLMLDVGNMGKIKGEGADDDEKASKAFRTGQRTRVIVRKNQIAPPFKEAEFDIVYGKGVDLVGDIFDIAVAEGAIEKSGSWYSVGGKRLGQGKDNAKRNLTERDLLAGVCEAIGVKAP